MTKSEFKPFINAKDVLYLDYLKFILQASASSTKFGIIPLHEENNITHIIRGNLNALLIAPFGSGKTSTICKINNIDIINGNDLTFPGLIGTISKNGEFLPGSCWDASGKLLLMDETQNISLKVKDAMNSILEYPHCYSRKMGNVKILSPIKMKKGYSSIRAELNTFKVYAKFSCICSSMRIDLRFDVERAWFSRFVPIRIQPEIRAIYRMLKGLNSFEINALDFKGDFTFPDYLKFVDYHERRLENSHWNKVFELRPDDVGYIGRDVGDFIRMGAFMAALQESHEILFEDVKKTFDKFFDTKMYNTMIGPLSTHEYFVLNNYEKTEEELAEILGVTQQDISLIIKSLMLKHLLLPRKKEESWDIKLPQPFVKEPRPEQHLSFEGGDVYV
jgi:hypothetical protein